MQEKENATLEEKFLEEKFLEGNFLPLLRFIILEKWEKQETLSYNDFLNEVKKIPGATGGLEFHYAVSNCWEEMERLKLYDTYGETRHPKPLDKDLLKELKNNVVTKGYY